MNVVDKITTIPDFTMPTDFRLELIGEKNCNHKIVAPIYSTMDTNTGDVKWIAPNIMNNYTESLTFKPLEPGQYVMACRNGTDKPDMYIVTIRSI